jgi:hypothetical protein
MAVARRDLWIMLGLSIAAVSAAVSSFDGLRSLAVATGWSTAMAILFPLTLDSYALTSIRVWLTSSIDSRRVRAYAKWNAVGAILLSLAGNAAWHLIAAGLLEVTYLVVMVVGGTPPVILGLVVHLATLRQTERAATEAVKRPDAEAMQAAPTVVEPVRPVEPAPVSPALTEAPERSKSESGVRTQYSAYATEDELLEAARVADAAWRASHDGRPISRDELRKALKVSGARASAALRTLRGRDLNGRQSAAT